MKDTNQRIEVIKEEIINSLLMLFIVFLIPLSIIASVSRYLTTGYTLAIVVLPVFMLTITIVYFFRKKLTLKVRSITLVISYIVVTVSTFYSYGLLSMGVSTLIVINVLTALLFTDKTKWFMLSFSVCILVLFTILISSSIIDFDFNAESYSRALSTWLTQIIGFVFMVVSLTYSIKHMMNTLLKSFQDETMIYQQYHTLVENLDDIMYSIDKDGILLSKNSGFENIMGLTNEELIGTHYSEIFDASLFWNEADKLFWKEKIDIVLQEHKKVAFQYTHNRNGNEKRIYVVNLIPVLDEDGSVQQIIGNNRDVTELLQSRAKIEELLYEKNSELEQLVELKTKELKVTMDELYKSEKLASLGNLVAGVAHEINTPLGVAVTASSFLTDKTKTAYQLFTTEKLRKSDLESYLSNMHETGSIINDNLKRAAELVVSFKKISVNQSTDQETVFNLSEYINTILLTLKHEYKNTPYKFRVEVDEKMVIKSYPSALAQILTNLIMNSLIHGFDNEDQGEIVITCIKKQSDIVLCYSDNGKGILDHDLKMIFDPFFTTNRTKGGTGLGLSIVYNLITERLHGFVTCESQLGHGTSFEILLPDVLEYVEESI